ncbi:MAG: hypothetical protein RIT24_2374 [Planctomycetota bacterium]
MHSPRDQPPRSSDAASDPIDGFQIRSLIGEGGFGYVYLAEQSKPVRRLVALKVLKPGIDSPRVIARFQAEQQALALMEHPNVARVYGTGTTALGRPYFAMEYVDGPSIIEHCNRVHMSIEDRIRMFIAVCDGVQHAHARGIVHRDLKPRNIVISTRGEPTPKVIDFGIAKALDEAEMPSIDTADMTQTGNLIGTVNYASPEQIVGITDAIDARSDVYSLGVVLAELLAGATPIDLRGLHGALLAQTVMYVDPILPSDLPDTMPPERARTVAEERGLSIDGLKRALRGDLDSIVRKAMEKEPSERYLSAIELSADLVRALHHQPIKARRAGRVYRFRKFVRRRMRAIAISAAVAVAVLSASTYGVVRSFDATAARKESDAAIRQRADAQVATVDMLELLVGLLRDEYAEEAPGTRRMDLRTRLEQISTRGATLAISPSLEADLRLHLGRAFLSLRDFARAEVEARRCIDLANMDGMRDELQSARGTLLLSAVERESGDPSKARVTLSELAAQLQRIEQSSDAFGLDATEIASLDAKRHFESGLTFLALNLPNDAIEELNAALLKSPPKSIGHIALTNAARTAKIDALLTLGRAREAEVLAHDLLASQISVLPAGHRWIAATRSALGEALYRQNRGVEAEPIVASSHAILASSLSADSALMRASSRRMDELARILGRAVRIAPDLPATDPTANPATDITTPPITSGR